MFFILKKWKMYQNFDCIIVLFTYIILFKILDLGMKRFKKVILDKID